MSVDYEVLELQLQIAEQKLATAHRNLQITHQSLLDARAELGQVRPVADAAHLVCAEWFAGIRPGGKPGHLAWNGLLAAHRATTPAETPATHVIVAVDLLAQMAKDIQNEADLNLSNCVEPAELERIAGCLRAIAGGAS